MEWLQTYKIGKALIDSGNFKPIDAFYANPKWDSQKRNWIVDLIIDLDKNEVRINSSVPRQDEIEDLIRKDNLYVRGGKRFNGYYLCTPYNFKEEILFFFGLDYIPIKGGKKKPKDSFIEKYASLLIKTKGYGFNTKQKKDLIKKINTKISQTQLANFRKLVCTSPVIVDKLQRTISFLDYLIEQRKQTEFNQNPQNIEEIAILELRQNLNSKEKKRLNLLRGKSPNLEELIPIENRLDIKNNGKGNDEILYLRTFIENGKDKIYLNRLDEYKDYCQIRLIDAKFDKTVNKPCFFSSEIPSSEIVLPRDDINILKISVGDNKFSPFFNGTNFLISKNTYGALKLGAKFIKENLSVFVSGIKHYIIPDFRTDIDIEKLCLSLNKYMDLAFQVREYEETRESIYQACNQEINSIVFVGHKANDRVIELTNTIRVLDFNHFENIFICFEESIDEIAEISNFPFNFSFKSIYGLFVERYKKDGNKKLPLNKPKSLAFFKMLFEGEVIDKFFLIKSYIELINIYKYGSQAKEKEIYYGGTLNIYCGKKLDKKLFDSKISKATKKYLILLNLTRRLNLLRAKTIQKMEKPEYAKLNKNTINLFSNNDYSNEQKALFFLGKMLCRVAYGQHKKGAKHKPVLNKINYSGMTFKDLIWLSCEVFDKMRQYNKSLNTFNFGEQDLGAFKFYFDQFNENTWRLTEMENVFYIFSGYALYWETLDKDEADINKKLGITEDKVKEPDTESIDSQPDIDEDYKEI